MDSVGEISSGQEAMSQHMQGLACAYRYNPDHARIDSSCDEGSAFAPSSTARFNPPVQLTLPALRQGARWGLSIPASLRPMRSFDQSSDRML